MKINFQYFFDLGEYRICLLILALVTDDANLLLSRLNSLEKSDRIGIIGWEEKSIELSRIRLAILELYNINRTLISDRVAENNELYYELYSTIEKKDIFIDKHIFHIYRNEINKISIKNGKLFSANIKNDADMWLPLLIIKWSLNNYEEMPEVIFK